MGRAPRDDGSTAHNDGYGSLKKTGRRRVRNTRRRVQGQATTAEIVQREVARRATMGRGSGDDECCSGDDG